MSVAYYTRLEQGHSGHISTDLLQAVGHALRLNPDECRHLSDLAAPRSRTSANPTKVQTVRDGIWQLLETADRTPILVLGRRTDVLASNHLARMLFTNFDALPQGRRSFAHFLLLDPHARELFIDWADVAIDMVSILRMHSSQYPDDAQLSALVADLNRECPEFIQWWSEHNVHEASHGTKRLRHPLVGELTVSYESLHAAGERDQTIFIYTVEPGSRSEEALRILNSLPTPATR